MLVVSVVYLSPAGCLSLSRCSRGERAKELEILVLRHELSILRYVRVFICIGSRRIEYVACTSKPDGAWMLQH